MVGKLWGGFALAAAGGGFDFAGLIDDARKFFDNKVFTEALGARNENERNMGAAEEFFHVARIATGVFGIVLDAIFELDGTDRAEGFFVAEDEIDGFVINEAIGGITILEADFVAQEGGEANFGDDIEFLTEKVVKDLETLLGGANHEMLAGAIFEAVDSFALTAAGGDASEHGHQKEEQQRNDGHGNIDLIWTKKLLKLHKLPLYR